MAEYRLLFHPEALAEFRALDGAVRKGVLTQIEKLRRFPQLGEALGNKHGCDLSGYRKLYADKKRIRIVYTIVEDRVLVAIIAIGKRDDLEAYRDADSRRP